MKFRKIIFSLVLIATSLLAERVLAAQIYFEQKLPKTANIRAGDEILLDVILDSKDVEYNALEGHLSVSSEFSIKEIVTGNSLISIWLENPQNHENDQVTFSGITPSGYNNQRGLIFSVILKAEKRGSGKITVNNLNLFRNDGLGTREAESSVEKTFYIGDLSRGEIPYTITLEDSKNPMIAEVELVREKDLFDGDWSLLFLGSDKGSGIERFSVIEGSEIFENVSSPYHITHQRLNKKISLIAHDADGNSEIVSVSIPGKVCLGRNCYGWLEPTIIIFIGITIWVFLKSRCKKSF